MHEYECSNQSILIRTLYSNLSLKFVVWPKYEFSYSYIDRNFSFILMKMLTSTVKHIHYMKHC